LSDRPSPGKTFLSKALVAISPNVTEQALMETVSNIREIASEGRCRIRPPSL